MANLEGLERVLAEFGAQRPDWHLSLQGVNSAWYASINPTAAGTSGEFGANANTPAEAIRRAMILADEG